MKANPARVKLTYDDFLLFPDDGKRHELIDGEHYVTPSPNIRHQTILGNLYFLIRTWLEHHPVGRAFMAPLDVRLHTVRCRRTRSVVRVRMRAADILTAKHVTGAPDIVVEIGSPSTRKRDETIKRRLYERSGVSEYWVVDPDLDVVRVYRNRDGRFDRPVELRADAGDVLTSPHLDGLEMPVGRIFSE